MKLLVRRAKQLHQRLKCDCLLLGIDNLLSAHIVEYFETVRIQLVIHRHNLFELRFATGVRRGSLCVKLCHDLFRPRIFFLAFYRGLHLAQLGLALGQSVR